ncbi:MAG TPA: TonB family protein [Planctomycetota bacterium]
MITRFLSFGGSTALHAGLLGAFVWAGLASRAPEASVAVSTPVPIRLEAETEDPSPVEFDAAPLPESLPLAEAELEFEPERVVDISEPVRAFAPSRERPAERPLRDTTRVPAAAEPASEVEAEIAAVEIYNPPPAYPPAARRRSQEGHALIGLRILKDGSVADPVVLECVGSPLFAEAALKAVIDWRYQPATLGGVPVDRVHRVRFTFKIQT